MASDKNLVEAGAGMTDLGLQQSRISDVGKPGSVLGGPSALESALLQMGDPQSRMHKLLNEQPTTRGAARQVFSNPISALLSAALVGGGAIAGGGEGAIAGLQGVMGGIEKTHAINQEEYSKVVAQATAAVEQRNKLAAAVRTLVGQQPELFQNEDPQLLGEAAFPGMGLSLDPRSKLTASKTAADRKFQFDSVMDLMKQAETPVAKRALSRMAFNLLPGDHTQMPAEIFDSFWKQNGEYTDDQLAKWFGMSGVNAAGRRAQTGILDYSGLTYSPQGGDITPFKRWHALNTKVQTYKDLQTAKMRHLDLDTAAQEGLTEVEYQEWLLEQQKVAPELGGTEAFRAWLAAANSVNSFLLFNPAKGKLIFGGRSTDEVITDFAIDALGAAKETSRHAVDIDFQTLFLKKKALVESYAPNKDMTLQEITDAAIRLTKEDLRSRGSVQSIPVNLRDPEDRNVLSAAAKEAERQKARKSN